MRGHVVGKGKIFCISAPLAYIFLLARSHYSSSLTQAGCRTRRLIRPSHCPEKYQGVFRALPSLPMSSAPSPSIRASVVLRFIELPDTGRPPRKDSHL
ncbi:hypothetical protein Pmani_012186 [Petrolisthes manimaculis]|uniref:Uncharacterized protein n=1 Tax=Petrolisthes manimaculis TaxID=1843537 RepID=A0AAE1Q1E5_9EUCA|nr:hypothetical protein Pmani_012186 [Petrolisthes manimaculis]